ncbi:MAG: hypothetical protein JWN97_2740 [Nocardioides sp.]|nr:hypothetical protein [Nocardioides sp.]
MGAPSMRVRLGPGTDIELAVAGGEARVTSSKADRVHHLPVG